MNPAKRKRNDLSLSQKLEVIKLKADKVPQIDIASRFGCSASQIFRILAKSVCSCLFKVIIISFADLYFLIIVYC